MTSTYSYLRIDDTKDDRPTASGVFFYRHKPGSPVEVFGDDWSDAPTGWRKVVGVEDLDESLDIWQRNGARSVERVSATALPESARRFR